MSNAHDLYSAFTREMLENFLWHHQATVMVFEDIEESVRDLDEENLVYVYHFECPSEQAAEQLKARLLEEEVSADADVAHDDEAGHWTLQGSTADLGLDLAVTLRWVGFLCDAGNEFGCRFDGWELCESELGEALEDHEHDDDEEAEDEEFSELPQFPHLVIARIMDPVLPDARAEKYEDPLMEVLEGAGLGTVTGGGTCLNPDADPNAPEDAVDFVEIEIELANLDAALDLTRITLEALGAPEGSVLQFSRPETLDIVEPSLS